MEKITTEKGNQVIEDAIYILKYHTKSKDLEYADRKIFIGVIDNELFIIVGDYTEDVELGKHSPNFEKALENTVFYAEQLIRIGKNPLTAVYVFRTGKWMDYIHKIANELQNKHNKLSELNDKPIDDSLIF